MTPGYPDRLSAAIDAYQAGAVPREVAKQYHVWLGHLYDELKARGIARRTRHEVATGKSASLKQQNLMLKLELKAMEKALRLAIRSH